MELVKLGKSVKLHGYLGQFKIVSKFDGDFDINLIDCIFDANENEYKVNRIFKTNDGIVVALQGVELEKAKSFLGKDFYIKRDVTGNKILFEDLKDSDVYVEGKLLGKIFDIQDFGSAEVVYVKTEKGELMFPCVSGIIDKFSREEKRLDLNSKKFKEVCDYED